MERSFCLKPSWNNEPYNGNQRNLRSFGSLAQGLGNIMGGIRSIGEMAHIGSLVCTLEISQSSGQSSVANPNAIPPAGLFPTAYADPAVAAQTLQTIISKNSKKLHSRHPSQQQEMQIKGIPCHQTLQPTHGPETAACTLRSQLVLHRHHTPTCGRQGQCYHRGWG